MYVDSNLQKRTVITMAMTEQTVTTCVSNYSGQWFNNCLARINVKGLITAESHIYKFSAYIKQNGRQKMKSQQRRSNPIT